MGRGKLAKKQEEIQFYKSLCFKLKQQRETLKQDLTVEKLRAKDSKLTSDERLQMATRAQEDMRRAQEMAERLKLDLRRSVRGGSIPWDFQEEITLTRALFEALPEYSFTLPDLVNRKDGFMWKRNGTPPWSPYFGIGDEWLIGEFSSVNMKASMAQIKWYKANIQG